MKILERNYISTYHFVNLNKLESQATELFGLNWVAEDDISQIENLLEFIGADFYEVEFVEGLSSDEDILVYFNHTQKALNIALKKLAILDGYFECFSKEQQDSINQDFESAGLNTDEPKSEKKQPVKSKVVTYDDTRDIAIKVIRNFVEQGLLEDDDDTYFQFQDTIQDEINEVLGLDIDDNFEVNVFNKKEKKSSKNEITQAQELHKILGEVPVHTALNFFLIPNDGSEEDGDDNDKFLENLQVIYSGGLDSDEPFLDFGLQFPKIDDSEPKIKLIPDKKYEDYFSASMDLNGITFESVSVNKIEEYKKLGFDIEQK